jgi:hypothetical protein
MKRINTTLFLFIIIAFQLNAQDYIDNKSFSDLFGRACNNILNLETESISIDGTQSAFRAYIYGEYAPGGYKMTNVFYLSMPAAILNYGNRFEYSMYSQKFPSMFATRIMEELEDIKEDFLEEYDDINAKWDVIENSQILLTAKYSYDGGGATESRLHFLFQKSQKLVTELVKQIHLAKSDYQDELEDMDLGYLSRFDLNSLMPNEEFESYVDNYLVVKEGAYRYSLRDISVGVRNNGDNIELVYINDLPSDTKDEASLIASMKEIAIDNMPDGDPEISVTNSNDGTEEIWIVAKYRFNKSFSGEDLVEYFEDFMSDFINEMDMEYEDLIEDL